MRGKPSYSQTTPCLFFLRYTIIVTVTSRVLPSSCEQVNARYTWYSNYFRRILFCFVLFDSPTASNPQESALSVRSATVREPAPDRRPLSRGRAAIQIYYRRARFLSSPPSTFHRSFPRFRSRARAQERERDREWTFFRRFPT